MLRPLWWPSAGWQGWLGRPARFEVLQYFDAIFMFFSGCFLDIREMSFVEIAVQFKGMDSEIPHNDCISDFQSLHCKPLHSTRKGAMSGFGQKKLARAPAALFILWSWGKLRTCVQVYPQCHCGG